MSEALISFGATTPGMAQVWSDQSTLGHALQFEAALANAQSACGLLDNDTADRVAQVCESATFDTAQLSQQAALAGTLAIPLVRQIREALPEEIQGAVHMGATSQDLADTVMMLQVRDAAALLSEDAARICKALAALTRKYASTPAMGRTLLQDALPIGLGLRMAQWHAGIAAAASSLDEAVRRHALLQFGGAVGTRSNLDGKGDQVAQHLAEALGLPAAPPWHARRTGVAAIAASVAILVGAVGKMARDIGLLAQGGIAEMHEPQVAGRGGSSAMAHKRNPTGCQTALSAATRAPGLAATIFSALPAEQERGLGGWQAEWPVMAELFQIAAAGLAAMADVAEGLEIDEAALAANLGEGNAGIGESAALVESILSAGSRGD